MNADHLKDNIEGKIRLNKFDVEIGKRVKELRLIRGMTQDDLAKKVQVTFQQIQKYEKGLNRINVSRLIELAAALSVTPGYFFSEKKPSDDESSSNNGNSSLHNKPKALHEDGESFEYNHGENDAESKEILGLVREYQKIKNKKSRNAVYSLIKSLSLPEN